jgi:hypothetical protein
MGQQVIDCKHKFIYKHEFFTHTSISYLLEDTLLLDQPIPLLLEGVNDVFHIDLSLNRHIRDIL